MPFASSRRPEVLVAALVLALLPLAPASGQTCHMPSEAQAPAADFPFRAHLGFLVSGYERGQERGDYQGMYAGFGYRHPWFAAELSLPAYRLARAGEDVEFGLGDLVLTARGTGLRARDGAFTLGAELSVMVPTGRDEVGIGMGHVMLMPAAWFALDLEPFSLRAQAGYGRVLGAGHGGEHAAHGGSLAGFSLVNPMNRSEFEHALSVGLQVQRYVNVYLRWLGAVPIADGEGITRQVLGGGAALWFQQADVSAELQRAVAGDAFDWKVILQAGARF